MQLPSDIEKSHLLMEMTLLGNLTARIDPFSFVPKVAEFASTLNPQTRSLFKEFKKFIGLCLCLPVLGKIVLGAQH